MYRSTENGFYEKLNALKFVPQQELSREQAYWLPANEIASNASNPATPLKDQLQGKDDTIRNLQTHINIMCMLNVGSFDKQALETELTQLKDAITSVRIQNDGFKVENENVKRRYKDLSKTITHSRDELTGKITALTAENAKLKTELISKISSGSIACEKPKVLAPGMYAISPKYIPPQRRVNRVVPKYIPPKTSNRHTQKPSVQQNKKPNVPVNLSTRTKPATESRKPMPKSHTRNHRILPSKSVKARRAADHNRRLNVVDHNQFVIRSLKSVNTKTPQAKHSVNHTKKVWKATRNHNVNTTKTAWRPTGKVVGSVKPQWKPTRRHFAFSKVTMISRFPDCKLSDRKAGSKGISGMSKGRTVADSIAERLTRPTAYKFKTDCSIIPVWVPVFILNQESLHTKLPHNLCKSMTSSNLNVMEIRRRNIIKAFLESHRYEACETKDQRMQSQVKEDHKVIQRSKLKQVKDQDQVITSTSEDHESRCIKIELPK
ncbi:hypothetical protein Tco_0940773 [Tanacetum coccineum]|uniref:Uncharacterized protein n=1 Tax=Tanacetum coccineum TaxID=301880 RepID=A0ABQ5DQN8_9ASTR